MSLPSVKTLVGNFATVANFRAQASASFTVNSRATCIITAGNRATYRWDSASSVADNGISVVKPNDVGGAGRWVVTDWIETTSEVNIGVGAYPVDLGPVDSPPTPKIFNTPAGWELFAITIEGAGPNRIAWFKRVLNDS